MNGRKTLGRAAMFLAAAGAAGAQSTESWSPKKASVGGPIRSGYLLFLSGIGGWYPERRPSPGTFASRPATPWR